MQTYKLVLFNIYQYQYAHNFINETWKHIFDDKCRDLIKMVKERTHQLCRARYKEKLHSEFAPFTTFQHFRNCEEWLWFLREKSHWCAMNVLRNQFALIYCLKELLRHESLVRRKLSDLLHMEIKRNDNEYSLFISILQIEEGKTASARCRQYGSALQGKDVNTFLVGAFGFYLHYSGEMDDGDCPNLL